MVERARLLREREYVLSAVVLDGEIPLFNIDVRRAVFTHGAELNQMTIWQRLAHGEQNVEGTDHIVDLREYRVLSVDHRVRRGALLGKMDDGIWLEGFQGGEQNVVVRNVAHKNVDSLSCESGPHAKTVTQWLDGRKSLCAQFVVPLAAEESYRQSRRRVLSRTNRERSPSRSIHHHLRPLFSCHPLN